MKRRREEAWVTDHTHQTPRTGILVPDIRVHKEPVVKGDELEESEARSTQITKPVRVYFLVQPSTNNGKYV